MTIPAALVQVTFKSLTISDGIRSELDKATDPYALALVGLVETLAMPGTPVPDFEVLGRSPPLPPGEKVFDFTAPPKGKPRTPMRGPTPTPQSWDVTVRLDAGLPLPVRVSVYSSDPSYGLHWETKVDEKGKPVVDDKGQTIYVADPRPRAEPIATFMEYIQPPWPTGVREIKTNYGTLVYEITTRPVPTKPQSITATHSLEGTDTKSDVQLWTRIVLEITDVEGLYRGTSSPAARVPGYTGQDYCGRIFLNRDRKDPKVWKANHQSILLTVKAHVIEGLPLPADAKIEWTLDVPNDITNDVPLVSRATGALVDPSDYDSDARPIGAHDEGNVGKVDHRTHWEQVSPHTLTDVAPALSEGYPGRTCQTAVVGGVSKVIVHCPNVAGDRIRVRATLKSKALEKDAEHVEIFDDWTGVLHMWNRFDVEYIVAPSAAALDLTKIPPQFGMLCAQLDFVTTKLDKDPEFAPEDRKAQLAKGEGILVSRARTLTKKVGKPGWLFLISVTKHPDAEPLPTAEEMRWFASGSATHVSPAPPGDATTGTQSGTTETYVADIDPATWQGLGPRLSAKLEWAGKTRPAVVDVADAGAQTDGVKRTIVTVRQSEEYRIHFGFGPVGVDAVGLDDHDALAYDMDLLVLPTKQRASEIVGLPNSASSQNDWLPGGWDAVDPITISFRKRSWGMTLGETTWPASWIYTDAIEATPPAGSLSTEAGTTLHTAVHELTHNFAMVADQCGFWDWKHDMACCMTYSNQWMLHRRVLTPQVHVEIDSHTEVHEERLRPVPVPAPMGLEHCGRHIVIGRRVRWPAHKTHLKW